MNPVPKSLPLRLEQIALAADKADPSLQSENCQMTLAIWEDYYPKIGFNPPWTGYFVKLGDHVVGTCAFTGPPVNNTVEVSYWTFKQFEAQGISTGACRLMISIARAADPGIRITAKTAPAASASTTILEKCGFVFTRIVQDHEIGDAWEWSLKN